ncbi:MAG: hypothetical protein R2799_13900 [Crocinitomicaceae bacterium]
MKDEFGNAPIRTSFSLLWDENGICQFASFSVGHYKHYLESANYMDGFGLRDLKLGNYLASDIYIRGHYVKRRGQKKRQSEFYGVFDDKHILPLFKFKHWGEYYFAKVSESKKEDKYFLQVEISKSKHHDPRKRRMLNYKPK